MNFLVVVDSYYTRDIQVCRGDWDDDNDWKDAYGDVVLGIYTCGSKEEALKTASIENGVPIEYLNWYVLNS